MGGMLDIGEIRVRVRSLVPGGAAEVWITVVPQLERDPPPRRALQVRGRLMGPICAGRSTVEVAYPLRPLPDLLEGDAGLTARTIIPEPSLWDIENPFCYGGPVELWDGPVLVRSMRVSVGLRELRLGPGGLRWNGQPLTLRGGPFGHDPAAMKRAGFNLVVVPPEEGSVRLWQQADECGLAVLYRWSEADYAQRLTLKLAQHPCGVGWSVPAGMIRHPAVAATCEALAARGTPLALGVELDAPPRESPPPGVRFVVCAASLIPRIEGVALPKLVRGEGTGETMTGIFGTIV
jgi:hypothetical protein